MDIKRMFGHESNIRRQKCDMWARRELPHGMHADAIRKLYRFATAKYRQGESLYKDAKMANDETQLEHIVAFTHRVSKR
ncbi:hypothetical protein OUZ56_018821 [Daphnia magna]|uniref:Uncharacterized protein n=1 Tax=Daphnia magna TaxID=35525 RepID=A0ABQ9Z9Y2_9CRUS|nr:hypothetical protein OUZ56_018821 [Daphnia magna]